MQATELIELVLGLLVFVTLIVTLSRRVGIPYPILLVIGGLFLGLLPGLETVTLEPELVFLLFLPPILFSAGFLTSVRDFRANLGIIALLAVGLVIATTVAVGVVIHMAVPQMGWAAAFALGAIVSPPDAIAATAIAQRLGLPERIVTVLEGESLVNDATALVMLRFAVAAASTEVFSAQEAAVAFAGVSLGGIAIGVVVGLVTTWLMPKLHDPPVEVAVSMLAPFAAFLPAEQVGLSGVLATVTAGIIVGYRAPRVMSSDTRVLGGGAWQILLFVLNGLAFILIGLQLPAVLTGLSVRQPMELIGLAALVCATVIVVRLAWVFVTAVIRPQRPLREPDEYDLEEVLRTVAHPWRSSMVLGWAGMRGVVSLAAALSIPLVIRGEPFPERHLIIFLAFSVILVTLVGQGLTLPFLIRLLGLGEDGTSAHEEAHARQAAVEAAVDRIEQLAKEWPEHRPLIDQLRVQYTHRLEHLSDPHAEGPSDEGERELLEHRIIRRAVIDAERDAVIGMRDRGAISDNILRRLERELDLEELRLEA